MNKCPRPIGIAAILISCALTYSQSYAQPDPALAPNQPASQQRYGQGLGRLLTTEQERTKLDDIRFNVAPPSAPIKAEPPAQWHIDGITNRPDRPEGQRITVWIDGKAHLENALPYGLKLVKDTNGQVKGVESKVSQNKTEFAHIGDAISRPQTPDEAKQERETALAAKAAANTPSAIDAAKTLVLTPLDKAKDVLQNALQIKK